VHEASVTARSHVGQAQSSHADTITAPRYQMSREGVAGLGLSSRVL